jgi:glycosyltransferase involved in cell wall biosynthesis
VIAGQATSVVLTTCQGRRFVELQLRSIVEQTNPPDEVIILDDASTDGTPEIVRRLLEGGSIPWRLISNPTRLGVLANLEQGLRLAKGDVVALADQDDIWRADKLSRLVPLFQQDPRLAVVFTDAATIDDAGEVLSQTLWDRVGFTQRRQARWQQDPLQVVLRGEIATGATMILRTDYLQSALPFPRHRYHDSWFVLTALLTGAAVHPDKQPSISYRVHAGNQAGVPPEGTIARLSRFGPNQEIFLDIAAQFDEALRRYGASADPTALHQVTVARDMFLIRGTLPASRLKRVPAVLRLLPRRGYRTRNATHDLLARSTPSRPAQRTG